MRSTGIRFHPGYNMTNPGRVRGAVLWVRSSSSWHDSYILSSHHSESDLRVKNCVVNFFMIIFHILWTASVRYLVIDRSTISSGRGRRTFLGCIPLLSFVWYFVEILHRAVFYLHSRGGQWENAAKPSRKIDHYISWRSELQNNEGSPVLFFNGAKPEGISLDLFSP